MGIFGGQLANVVEWTEYRDDVLFWKWNNNEIKKGSKLIIRPGQDAIFMFNGAIEGVFEQEGSYDIESQIIPFLSTLKSFKFGFNTPMRAEVMFINTKEFTGKWGTKNPIAIPAQGLPGGMPIRSFGTFNYRVSDASALIDKVSGIKQQFTMDDVRDRITAVLDQTLMRWIVREGKDMFNLQAYSAEIGEGVRKDLDYELSKIGISVTGFSIQSFSYPEEVAKMQQKAAAAAMVGNVDSYTKVQYAESLNNPHSSAGSAAADMTGMAMGMAMAQQMVNSMNSQNNQNMGYAQNQGYPQNQGYVQNPGYPTNAAASQSGSAPANYPKFCPNCGHPTNGNKFCPECGQKLV